MNTSMAHRRRAVAPSATHGHFDDIEIDRPLGRKLAARVGELVAANGGTNEKAARVLGLSHNAIGKLRKASPVARYTPETIEALKALAGAMRRRLQRELAAATRHAELRRKKERRRLALVRHIKRSRG